MNRLSEYRGYVKNKQKDIPSYKKLFFDTLREDIVKLNKNITNTLNYKNILILEKNLNKIIENTNQTLNVIELQGNEDEYLHFDGIKKIIQSFILETKFKLEKLKIKKTTYNIELEPEKQQVVKEQIKYNPNIQMESIEIMGNTLVERYRVTRERLLEIESIQDNISEQLNIQDERIDDVIEKVGGIYKSVKESKNIMEKGSDGGSFLRRFLTILYFCLSFILLFLHFYYKKY